LAVREGGEKLVQKIDIPIPANKERLRRRGDRTEWRGSNDGITWTDWFPLVGPAEDCLVPKYWFYQARILVNGEWFTSPVTWDDAWKPIS
jgi:hypothetical protein